MSSRNRLRRENIVLKENERTKVKEEAERGSGNNDIRTRYIIQTILQELLKEI